MDKDYIYSIQLSGIRCTNCANKIKNGLKQFQNIIDIKINVLQEKVQLILQNNELDEILQNLKTLGFKIIGKPQELIQIKLVFQSFTESDLYRNQLKQKIGIQSIDQNCQSLDIVYDPLKIKGSDLQKLALQLELQPQIISQNIEQIKPKNNVQQKDFKMDMIIAIIFIIFYVIFGLFLPAIDDLSFLIEYKIFLDIQVILFIFIISTLYIVIKFGFIVYKSCFQSLKVKVLNMDSIITLGSFACILLFAIQLIQNEFNLENIKQMIDTLSTLSLILVITFIGRSLEKKAKQKILQSQQVLMENDDLSQYQFVNYFEPKNKKLDKEFEMKLNVALLEEGDYFETQQGFKLLVDCYTINQNLQIIDSIQYGNDDTVQINKGNEIKSGAKIQFVEIDIVQLQVKNDLDKSLISQISNQIDFLQNNCESEIESSQVLIKQVSSYFVQVVIVCAFIVLFIWIALIYNKIVNQDYYYGIKRAISLIVVSCPCAFGLAVPSVISISLQQGIKNGILIKKNNAFNLIKSIDSFIFDKTGTLIQKLNQISNVTFYSNDENLCWTIINILEVELQYQKKSLNHPIANFLYEYSLLQIKKEEQCYLQSDVKLSQNGIYGKIKYNDQNLECHFGNLQFQQQNNADIQEQVIDEVNQKMKDSQTCLLLAIDKQIKMIIYLDNKKCLRPEASLVIDYILKTMKKEVYILSGDDKETVFSLGQYLNIDEKNCFGKVDCNQKKKFIYDMKQNGKNPMYIGDGLNDILCLQESTLGVAINTQSQLNLQASDIILLNSDLWKIVQSVKILENGNLFMKICIFWAFSYNIIMIPFASGNFKIIKGMFYSFNLVIPAYLSAFAMSMSSLMVIFTANCIKYVSLQTNNSPNKIADSFIDGKKPNHSYIQMNQKTY